MTEQSVDAVVLDHYRRLIEPAHPNQAIFWPLISGHNCRIGKFKNWVIIIFIHTGNSGFVTTSGLGELPDALIGTESIDDTNKEAIRVRLEKHFMLQPRDGVVFIDPEGQLSVSELVVLRFRHEFALGLVPMKIFLSHKGCDKQLVRKFQETLKLFGFDPWLDEDNMPAGTKLERGMLQGFAESCAAVFFITPNFMDENFLATEVDYAIGEQRKKGDKFAIITLVFEEGAAKGKVPDLLHAYVWKEPKSELDALHEIVRALPMRVGDVRWR